MNYSNNEKLIIAAKGGDENALIELLKNNEGLCYTIANKYKQVDSIEDLISMCKIGFLKAYNSFDFSKNVQFSTYVFRVMENEIKMYYRKNKFHKQNNISIDKSVFEDGKEISLMDIIPNQDEGNISIEDLILLKDTLNLGLKKFREIDRKVFEMYYFKKVNQYNIAKTLGLTQASVSRILKKIISHLQKFRYLAQ